MEQQSFKLQPTDYGCLIMARLACALGEAAAKIHEWCPEDATSFHRFEATLGKTEFRDWVSESYRRHVKPLFALREQFGNVDQDHDAGLIFNAFVTELAAAYLTYRTFIKEGSANHYARDDLSEVSRDCKARAALALTKATARANEISEKIRSLSERIGKFTALVVAAYRDSSYFHQGYTYHLVDVELIGFTEQARLRFAAVLNDGNGRTDKLPLVNLFHSPQSKEPHKHLTRLVAEAFGLKLVYDEENTSVPRDFQIYFGGNEIRFWNRYATAHSTEASATN
jgi:hypothetical protein